MAGQKDQIILPSLSVNFWNKKQEIGEKIKKINAIITGKRWINVQIKSRWIVYFMIDR